ncbi:MAG: tripartite tricarboxylate transporter substrate binding protein [Betaproteobacteria bacterium]|nr:tripartite tricarboxylate transporter substrate binding protein [Betaproteobacteria bacterium]
MITNFRSFIAASVALVLSCAAYAQYPDRPVRLVMPWAVGGTGDILIRILANKMSQDTGKSFIVENKPGAAGRIGYQMVATTTPDGYTFVAGDGGYPMLPALSKSLPWNFDTALVPVTVYADTPYVIVVPSTSSIKTLRGLIAAAKQDPGKLHFGSSGTGGATHIASELLLQTAGVSMTHVPYKGNGDAVVGAITGVIDMLLTSVPTAMGQVRSGKLTALAVTSKTRVPALKDVPTAAEAGFEFDLSNWYGILAPAGTSTQHVDYLVQRVREALQSAQVKEAFAAQGAEPVIMSTAKHGRIIRNDVERWAKTIQAAGIKSE